MPVRVVFSHSPPALGTSLVPLFTLHVLFLEMLWRYRFLSSLRSFSVSCSALGSVKKKMPPKKAPIQEKKVLLGRPSNNLKIGIVGTRPIFFMQ